MYQVIRAKEADNDLNSIADYIALDNPYRAITFVLDLLHAVEKVLSEFPDSGTKHRVYHCIPYERYLIFYDINHKTKTVEITHIKNTAQYNSYKNL